MRDYTTLSYRGIHVAEYAAQLVPWIVEHFEIPEGSSIIDLGCGRGEYVYAFADCGMTGYGVTESIAGAVGSAVKAGDIESRLHYADGAFDVVFSKSTIEHLHHPERMLEEVFRILKPGGLIIVMCPDWRYCMKGFYSDCTQIRPFDIHSLAQIVELAGFDEIRAEMFRPSIVLLRNPRWRWLLVATASVLPYGWLGKLRFAHRKHFMAMVSARKVSG